MPDQKMFQTVIKITGAVDPKMLEDLKKMGGHVSQIANSLRLRRFHDGTFTADVMKISPRFTADDWNNAFLDEPAEIRKRISRIDFNFDRTLLKK